MLRFAMTLLALVGYSRSLVHARSRLSAEVSGDASYRSLGALWKFAHQVRLAELTQEIQAW